MSQLMPDAERIRMALKLLDDAWCPEDSTYDTQGVNQAHRVLAGGDAPRETAQWPVDEDAP